MRSRARGLHVFHQRDIYMNKLFAGASVALLLLAACGPTASETASSAAETAATPIAISVKTFDATVSFDPANIANSKVAATIRPSDLIVGFPGDYVASHPGTKFTSWEDDLINSTNFLDAGTYPTITFASTSVAPSGERSAKVTGDLTLKGVTKPITLDVTFAGEAASHPFGKVPAIGFSATGVFKRSDFGLDYLLPGIVGDEVKVEIEGDFLQKTAS